MKLLIKQSMKPYNKFYVHFIKILITKKKYQFPYLYFFFFNFSFFISFFLYFQNSKLEHISNYRKEHNTKFLINLYNSYK